MSEEISNEVGQRIKNFRSKRKMTLTDLSKLIGKSPSTISKYESGQISVDVETLYDLARAFRIHVEQLLVVRSDRTEISSADTIPAFFRGVTQFYSYLYDGRNNKLMRCVFDVLSQIEVNSYNIMVYMNYQDFTKYQICENTYWGTIEHYAAVTTVRLTNQDTPMEKASIQILASFLESTERFGLWSGLSSRPLMPVATKMMFTKELIQEDEQLLEKLKISKEDIRHMKSFNMFSIMS